MVYLPWRLFFRGAITSAGLMYFGAALALGKRRIFVGVIDPISKQIESDTTVCDRILEAVDFIQPENLGTTDDCGFSPFGDDISTSRDLAFAKIRARVVGTKMAIEKLGLSL
jgi:5-methyltetrahydropteroyltriglutamate--homocysteine methyltransferase